MFKKDYVECMFKKEYLVFMGGFLYGYLLICILFIFSFLDF